eukprot:820727-Rhodomonas_salina.2
MGGRISLWQRKGGKERRGLPLLPLPQISFGSAITSSDGFTSHTPSCVPHAHPIQPLPPFPALPLPSACSVSNICCPSRSLHAAARQLEMTTQPQQHEMQLVLRRKADRSSSCSQAGGRAFDRTSRTSDPGPSSTLHWCDNQSLPMTLPFVLPMKSKSAGIRLSTARWSASEVNRK